MPKGLNITVLAGAAGDDPDGEIGRDKILVATPDRSWMLDFGTRFSQTGRYFDEFLQPRAAVGLRDFLRMGLVPPLEGLLRDDLSAPRTRPLAALPQPPRLPPH